VRDKTNKQKRRENLSVLERKGGLMVEKKKNKREGSHFFSLSLSFKDIVERNICKSILESVRRLE
jgi:hypothetical protein